jgi:putative tryptophan/tyrosine transport system substrate-binding protein
MRRRAFLAAIGGAAATWPLAAPAQQPKMPTVGFLSTRTPQSAAYLLTAFHQGLKEQGYAEGNNVAIDYRWGRRDSIAALAADLVHGQVAAIFAGGSEVALAVKTVNTTIPTVFAGGSDPVVIGLVSSVNRPEGNFTGATIISHLLGAKRLEVLRQLVPNARLIAILAEINNPSTETLVHDTQNAARAIGLETATFLINSEASLETAFADMAQQKVSAIFVGGGPLIGNLSPRTAALAALHGLPAMWALREYVDAGGLMSYGSSFADSYRQGGNYVGRILKGEKPADLPVLQPTKFELVINLKTAKALGLAIPDKLLALADEVIE